MGKLNTFLRTKPVFVYLLPVFFILHGYTENVDFIPVSDALLLMLVYLAFSLGISLLFWLLYRNFFKANLVAFCMMGFHFFFGGMHDGLKRLFPGTLLVKYTFLLPLFCLLFLVLIIALKRSKKDLGRLTQYLNSLLLLLLLADTGWLISKFVTGTQIRKIPGSEFTRCDTCAKPDVYFILADEYAGSGELRDLFHFDNSNFEKALTNRGFHVISNSFSNYNYTPFSLASILNMDYLQLKDTNRSGLDLTYAYRQIKDSRVIGFFQSNEYKFCNYSVFDFEGQPAPVWESFFPVKTRLITSQTFLSRLDRDIRFNTVTILKSKKTIRNLTYGYQRNNDHIYDLTWRVAERYSTKPKFVYTHLMMPHYPYYFDKDGHELPFDRVVEGNQVHKEDYIGYLQYGNKKILELIDHIRKNSTAEPIIILMGDHGFRHFTEPVEKKYYFMNLASVYFPNKHYAQISDSTSTVNLFREILSDQFAQSLSRLKDSSIYLHD